MARALETDEPAERSDFETGLTADDRMDLRCWLRLLTCATMIERTVRQKLRDEFGITFPRFDLLAQLDRAPDGLTMGELSRRLMVTNGNVTGLIDRLVEEGLVERRPAPGDRRAQLVRLTKQGKRTFDAMAPVHQRWIHDMIGSMERTDMVQLYELLGGLKRTLAQSDLARAAQADASEDEPAK